MNIKPKDLRKETFIKECIEKARTCDAMSGPFLQGSLLFFKTEAQGNG